MKTVLLHLSFSPDYFVTILFFPLEMSRLHNCKIKSLLQYSAEPELSHFLSK